MPAGGLRRIAKACRQHEQRLGERVDVGWQRVGVDRVEDQLVSGVVRRADLPAAAGQLGEVGCGDQAEVADEPAAVEFVEIARLDVAVANAPLGEAGHCLRDLGERDDDGLEWRLREGVGDRRGDGHREPRAVGPAWARGQVRVQQRQDPGEVAEFPEELDFLDETAVRLMLRLRGVDQLKGDLFTTTVTRRAPDRRVPADAEPLAQRPRTNRVAGGSHSSDYAGPHAPVRATAQGSAAGEGDPVGPVLPGFEGGCCPFAARGPIRVRRRARWGSVCPGGGSRDPR
jgi:hypothetical protein